MSSKSNGKRGKKKLRPGSTREAFQNRVQPQQRVKSDSDEERDPGLMLGPETRAAEAVTVMWVLSTLGTLVSLLGALLFSIVDAARETTEETVDMLHMLPQWFIMVGAITGLCGLLTNFLTTALRNHQAPFVVKLISGMLCGLGLAVGLFVK